MKVSREGLIILFFGTLACMAFIRSGIALTLLTGLVLLCIPLFSIIWLLFSNRSISVKRELNEEGVAGEQIFTTYSLRNNSLFPAFSTKFSDEATRGYVTSNEMLRMTGTQLRESISSFGRILQFLGITLLEEVDLFEESYHKVGIEGEFPVEFSTLIRGNSIKRTIPVMFPVRGKYRVGPGRIELSDPLGLFRYKIKAEGFSEVLILPSWKSLKFFPIGGSSTILREENIQRDREGTSPEFFNIREYQPGDPLKFVHWKLTAKHGEIIVKQFTQQVESTWGIIIDLKKGYNAGEGRETSLEYMIEIAVSILEIFNDDRIPHVLILAGDEIVKSEALKGEKVFNEELRILAASRNDGSLHLENRANALVDEYPQLSWILLTARKDEDIVQTAQALQRFGGTVIMGLIEMNSFLTDTISPEMVTSWRQMWGIEMENFDARIMSTGTKLCKVKKGDDLSLVFYS